MRIIGGIHRSRKILPPKGKDTTRPMTDRVKTSLFDRLAIRGVLDEGVALDIFAGTGSLGLEALSRGCAHCTFVERDRDAKGRLERNIADLRLTGQAAIIGGDALSPVWVDTLSHKPVTAIFCDPPYALTRDDRDRARIAKLIESLAAVADDGAILTLRTDDHTAADVIDGWAEPVSASFGSMVLHFYQRPIETMD